MKSGLADRLQGIPGVESVTIDLEESGPGINVRLRPDADEGEVIDRLRGLLVTYGVRERKPRIRLGNPRRDQGLRALGVEVRIVPVKGGARVEVATPKVRSFRVVTASPMAIAQGLADAWCQVVGKIPVEVAEVSVRDGVLTVAATAGTGRVTGRADISDGWGQALVRAVGQAIGVVEPSGA